MTKEERQELLKTRTEPRKGNEAGYREFHKVFRDCMISGMTREMEFFPFSDHPELLPLMPGPKLRDAIKTGELTGIPLIICGKFGGLCSSGNPKCKESRKL